MQKRGRVPIGCDAWVSPVLRGTPPANSTLRPDLYRQASRHGLLEAGVQSSTSNCSLTIRLCCGGGGGGGCLEGAGKKRAVLQNT